MKHSLNSRLLLVLLPVTLCVWLAISAVIWALGNRAIERQVDNQLRTLVATVSYTIDALITAGYDGAPELSLLELEVVESGQIAVFNVAMPDLVLPMSFNVWHGETLRAMTQDSPKFEPPHSTGIDDKLLADGSQWRIIRSRLGDTDLWLVAGFDRAELASESRRLLIAILSPLLLGLLIIVPLIYYAVRNGLRPLRDLEQQIGQRSASDLHAVEADNIPVEVAPIVNALNRLLQQLAATIEKEKQITADAAHELQTPLAAIKTEAQLAMSHAQGIDRQPLIAIIERVNRASHSVKQLTALSRLESTAGEFTQPVNLYTITANVRDAYATQFEQRGLTVEIDGCQPVVYGNADMIQILVDNLLRNALNHALDASVIAISLNAAESTTLTIANACRPLSDSEWSLVTQRFYRAPGSQGNGSGLGMSIVQRICELHGARLNVGKGESGEGFTVEIEFFRTPEAEAA